MRIPTVLPVFLALAEASSASVIHRPRGTDQTLHWGLCEKNSSSSANASTAECATLTVPFDYTDLASNKTLELDVIRIAAQKQPSKGSILFNFGGPGADGHSTLLSLASTLMDQTGGEHDLVSWDPRGTGNTLHFKCWESDSQLGSMGNSLSKSSNIAPGRVWAEARVQAEACFEEQKLTGEYIGTVATVRDMMQIVDALGGDRLLRYWGMSYGTLLGATAALLFPERVERVILDGVVNPHEYWNAWDVEAAADADAAFDGFLSGCIKFPENCALAKKYNTSDDIKAAFNQFLDNLRQNPMVSNGTIVDYSSVVSSTFGAMYSPSKWPTFAAGLDALMSGDDTAHMEFSKLRRGRVDKGESDDQALTGISCGDKLVRANASADFVPLYADLLSRSPILGDGLSAQTASCGPWRFAAKERVHWPSNSTKTKHPILILNNRFDPITPLISAHNVSASFEGSVVLEQNGYGHTSNSQSSNCTVGYVQQFYSQGSLPKPATLCEIDKVAFDVDVSQG